MKKTVDNKMLCVQPLPQTIVSCRDKNGKVEAVNVEEEYLDANGNILWDKMDLI